MALTGRLLADFSDFYTAVQKAEVSLKKMDTGAGNVTTSLNRMVDSLSGRGLVREATLAAEAVERIGGVSKLTESELAKLGARANEAVVKLKALGQDVPPGIQKIADAANNIKPPLDRAQSSATNLFASLKNAASVVGIAFSVGAITRFVGSVFDAASAIKDVSDKLGISTEAAQRFKFAAEQTGATLDDVGTAINFMNKSLAEGDKGTVKALKDAGLEFQTIRNMKPEDAFTAIADAIKKIEDPMLQADVAAKLFSRSAGTMPLSADGR